MVKKAEKITIISLSSGEELARIKKQKEWLVISDMEFIPLINKPFYAKGKTRSGNVWSIITLTTDAYNNYLKTGDLVFKQKVHVNKFPVATKIQDFICSDIDFIKDFRDGIIVENLPKHLLLN